MFANHCENPEIVLNPKIIIKITNYAKTAFTRMSLSMRSINSELPSLFKSQRSLIIEKKKDSNSLSLCNKMSIRETEEIVGIPHEN